MCEANLATLHHRLDRFVPLSRATLHSKVHMACIMGLHERYANSGQTLTRTGRGIWQHR